MSKPKLQQNLQLNILMCLTNRKCKTVDVDLGKVYLRCFQMQFLHWLAEGVLIPPSIPGYNAFIITYFGFAGTNYSSRKDIIIVNLHLMYQRVCQIFQRLAILTSRGQFSSQEENSIWDPGNRESCGKTIDGSCGTPSPRSWLQLNAKSIVSSPVAYPTQDTTSQQQLWHSPLPAVIPGISNHRHTPERKIRF